MGIDGGCGIVKGAEGNDEELWGSNGVVAPLVGCVSLRESSSDVLSIFTADCDGEGGPLLVGRSGEDTLVVPKVHLGSRVDAFGAMAGVDSVESSSFIFFSFFLSFTEGRRPPVARAPVFL
jgi:hypothetical protein